MAIDVAGRAIVLAELGDRAGRLQRLTSPA
jgi:hypothetical protein